MCNYFFQFPFSIFNILRSCNTCNLSAENAFNQKMEHFLSIYFLPKFAYALSKGVRNVCEIFIFPMFFSEAKEKYNSRKYRKHFLVNLQANEMHRSS